MALRTKTINGKKYYYLDLSYFVSNKSKTFSKYVGTKKPLRNDIAKIGQSFKSEIIAKLAGKHYDNKLISKDDLIKALLFRAAFKNAFSSLSGARKRKYEVDSTILFTLTALTTEGVNVGLRGVQNAYGKNRQLNMREQISKNMLISAENASSRAVLRGTKRVSKQSYEPRGMY